MSASWTTRGVAAPLLARKRTFAVEFDGFALAVAHGRLLLHRRSEKRGWFVSVLQFMDYRLEPHKKTAALDAQRALETTQVAIGEGEIELDRHSGLRG